MAEEAQFSDGDSDLGEVATAAQQTVTETDGAATPAQNRFQGMDYSKVTFVGVQYDTLAKDFEIGQDVQFLVTGRVKAIGDEAMNDGHIRHGVKVKVSSVVPAGESQ